MKPYVFYLAVILFVSTAALCSGQALVDEDVDRATTFVSQLSRADFTSAISNFNNGMKSALPVDKLQGVWGLLTSQYGEFKRQTGTQTSVEQGYEVVLVKCEFEKMQLVTKLLFDEMGKVAGLWFVPDQTNPVYAPPNYVKPGSYTEKEIIVGGGEWALPGTLTIPNGKGPFPAVVMVHGSGPMDRDETVGPNKPFRDIALALASNGVAVLRYEKRTKQYAQKVASASDNITVREETIDDAWNAVSLLKSTPDIDPMKIFVLGHSLGGMLLPRIVKADSQIAGMIVMAGTTRPLEDVILEQSTYLFSLNPNPSQEDVEAINKLKNQIKRIKDPEFSERVSAWLLPFGIPASYWLDLRGYNPPSAAKVLKQPMLILQGGRDYQVTVADFQGWQNALSSRTDVTFKFYPSLNHLFMEGQGKSTPTEYQRPGHVSPVVVSDIVGWVKGQASATSTE